MRPYFAFDRVLQGVLDVTGPDLRGDLSAGHRRAECGIRRFASTRCWTRAGWSGACIWTSIPRPNKATNAYTQHGSAGRGGQAHSRGRARRQSARRTARRSRSDDARRGAHALPRVRPRRASAGRRPSAVVRPEQRRVWSATSSRRPRRCSRNGSGIRRRWRPSRRTIRPDEPIPAALVMQMRRASEFGQGLEVRSQMVLARVVAVVPRPRSRSASTRTALWKEIHNRYLPYPHVDGTYRQASFTHLGQPRLRQRVLHLHVVAGDREGSVQPGSTRAICRRPAPRAAIATPIFAPGSSKPAAALVRDFLGRPFNATRGRRG